MKPLRLADITDRGKLGNYGASTSETSTRNFVNEQMSVADIHTLCLVVLLMASLKRTALKQIGAVERTAWDVLADLSPNDLCLCDKMLVC